MRRRRVVSLTLVAACAGGRGDSDDPLLAERARQEALCGDDASCLRRLQLRADGADADDAPAREAADAGPAPVVAPSGPWYCFEGGSPNDPVGACEQAFADCSVTEQAAREAGLRITRSCEAHEAVSCVGVVREESAVLFCAPTPEACARMERKLVDGDYEPFASCEVVGH